MGEALRLRRGLGAITLACGLLNAAAFALPRLLLLSGRLWSLIFFSQFLLLVCGGLGWLAFGYRRSRLFFAEPLIDFLLGVGVFVLLLSAVGWGLSSARLGAGWSLAPGAFLIFYGYELLRGRRLGVSLES